MYHLPTTTTAENNVLKVHIMKEVTSMEYFCLIRKLRMSSHFEIPLSKIKGRNALCSSKDKLQFPR